MKGIFTIAFFFLLLFQGMSQDVQFSQSYANPLYLNPAMAGALGGTRVVMNYRNQWNKIDNGYQAYSASGDFFIDDINGGAGLGVIKDVAGVHQLSNTVVSAYYAQHVRLSRKTNLAFGLKGSFGQRAFDDSNLLFADMVIRESSTSLSQPFLRQTSSYADVGAGILFYSGKTWFGVSLHRINEPKQSLITTGLDVIPMKLSVHGGAEIPVEDFDRSLGQKKLRVAFQYKQQGEWDQLDLGFYFSLSHITFGTWYRGLPIKQYAPGIPNNESLILLVGYEAPKRWSFGYSYDMSINRLYSYSGGSHEISLILEFYSKKKKRKRRIIPCAKF